MDIEITCEDLEHIQELLLERARTIRSHSYRSLNPMKRRAYRDMEAMNSELCGRLRKLEMILQAKGCAGLKFLNGEVVK